VQSFARAIPSGVTVQDRLKVAFGESGTLLPVRSHGGVLFVGELEERRSKHYADRLPSAKFAASNETRASEWIRETRLNDVRWMVPSV